MSAKLARFKLAAKRYWLSGTQSAATEPFRLMNHSGSSLASTVGDQVDVPHLDKVRKIAVVLKAIPPVKNCVNAREGGTHPA